MITDSKHIDPPHALPASSLAVEIVDTFGREALDLVLMVYLNFYYSELEIIDLCARWVPRRSILKEKSYLLKQGVDEILHANLFQSGVEQLGLSWSALDHARYRIADVADRFEKLYASDDELEVIVGLNLYAEGVIALEEIEQLSRNAPRYFASFPRILRDELTHLAYGRAVLRRLLQADPDNRTRAQLYCDRYRAHLANYLRGQLREPIDRAIGYGFVDKDFVASTERRFCKVMGEVGLTATI